MKGIIFSNNHKQINSGLQETSKCKHKKADLLTWDITRLHHYIDVFEAEFSWNENYFILVILKFYSCFLFTKFYNEYFFSPSQTATLQVVSHSQSELYEFA